MIRRIAREVLAAFLSASAAVLVSIGLIALASWSVGCAVCLAGIASGFACSAFGNWEGGAFGSAPHPWLFTAIGVAGALCLLLSRRLDSWALRLVETAHAARRA